MDKTTTEILQSINARFPLGRHASRIRLMIEGKEGFDYDEVIRHLNGIIETGGSDRHYIDNNDKLDAAFYKTQLTEYLQKSSK